MNNSETVGALHRLQQEASKAVYKRKNFVCGLCVAVFKSKEEKANHNASAIHHMVVSQNSKRQSLDNCELCNVRVGGIKNYLNHVKGRKHVKLVYRSVKRNISEIDKKELAVSQQTTRTQSQPINVSVCNTPGVTEADKNIHNLCFDDRLPFKDHAVSSNNNFLPLNTRDMQERHTMEKNMSYRGQDDYYDRRPYLWHSNSYRGYNEPHNFHVRGPWQSNRYFSQDRYGRFDSPISNGRNRGEFKDQSPSQFLKHSKDNRYPTEMGCRSKISHAKDKSDSGKNSNASSKSSIEKAEKSQDKTKNKIANFSKEETNSKVYNEISSTTDIIHEKNTNSSFASTSADVSGQLGAKLVSARVKPVINSEKVLSPAQIQHPASSSTDIRPQNFPGQNLPCSRSLSTESGDNKLEKWSKELQNMWPNMKSCDTDIINHMVHFPSTNKDRAALKFLIKEHSKSKRKLSYPRFNLPVPDSSVSKSLGEGYESMEKAVSNAVNVLPDNILNSLVCALDSDREEPCLTSPKRVTTIQINDEIDLLLPQIISTPLANKKRSRSKSDTTKKVRNSKKAKVVSEKISSLGSQLGEVPKSADKVDNINSEMENLLTDFLSSEKQTPFEQTMNTAVEFDVTKVKQEVVDVETESPAPMPSANISQLSSEPVDSSPSCVTSPSFSGEGLDIDRLMDLFAKGGVKVKSEFEDPVIEAMKSFGANVWEQVSSSSSATPSHPHTLTSPAAATGSPTPKQPTPELDKGKAPFPSAFKSNIKELVEMNKEEEQLHKELQEAEHEICHLQEMLNNWKAKKNEIQQKEIALRTKRQLLLEQLQGEFTEDPAKNPAPQNVTQKRSDALPTTPHLSNSPQKRCDTLLTHFERSHVTSTTSKSKTAKSEPFLFSFQSPNTSPLIDLEDSPDESKGQEHETEENCNSNELCMSLEGLLQAHSSAITCIEIFEGFMYTSSSDATAKRFSLKNPSEIVEYKGHTKSITGMCVFRTKVRDEASKKKKVCLFTSCYDGYLRSYLAESGIRVWTVDMQCSILCMCKGWGKLFLGLQNGNVAIITDGEVERSLQCATASIGRLTTSSQGALRLLCTVGYDGVATIWDTRTGLLLRCLEGRVKPPSYAQVCDNNIYLSSTEKSLLIQDISSGKLQRMLNWPASATGLAVCNHYIISSSYDGVIRCYDINKDFALHSMYYGAGNECIMCLTVCDNWIFTGNRKGLVEAVKFDPKVLEPCQFGRCHFKFGRRRDLAYHAALEHVRHMDKYCKACPWRDCTFSFTGALSSKAKERHITGHLLHD